MNQTRAAIIALHKKGKRPFEIVQLINANKKTVLRAHKSIDSLKQSLITAWNQIDNEQLRKIIDQFPKRLSACIKAKGGYFEKSL